MNMTNEDALRMFDKEFPNTDWDSVPDADIYPDVYVVKGRSTRECGPKHRRIIVQDHFTVDREYATREEAEAQVERCKTWENIIPGSLSIEAKKPEEACCKELYRDWRRDILAGKQVFPISLP